MKNKFLITTIILVSLCFVFGFTNSKLDSEDDEVKTVKIGTRIWTAENLDISSFSNGDAIKEAKSAKEWNELCKKEIPAFCYYNFDKITYGKYGKIYNAYSVYNNKKLVPEGFRIANEEDWDNLMMPLGKGKQKGKHLKSKEGWKNGECTNSTNFNALPGGFCQGGMFYDEGNKAVFWKLKYFKGVVYFMHVDLFSNGMVTVLTNIMNFTSGYYVRCVKE
jgi:uncharacterized protein (TIGR02145 family)